MVPIPLGQGGGTGGEGYVVLESTSTSSSSGWNCWWYNGERGKLYNDNAVTVLVFWI